MTHMYHLDRYTFKHLHFQHLTKVSELRSFAQESNSINLVVVEGLKQQPSDL